MGSWTQDWEGYHLGFAEIEVTARDLAKFGSMYLNDGEYEGNQVVPADWVHDSLQTYSEDARYYRVGRNFRDTGYGYRGGQSGRATIDTTWRGDTVDSKSHCR